MLGDRGFDGNWFRAALTARGITPCIPTKVDQKVPVPHERILYRQRHSIENLFGKLMDWRRIHSRHNRCAHTLRSDICIGATVIFRL